VALREQWYYKRRLVPFGEYSRCPPWSELDRLRACRSDFAADRTPDPMEVAGQALAPTICHEDSYGAEQLDLVRRSSRRQREQRRVVRRFDRAASAPRYQRMRALEAAAAAARDERRDHARSSTTGA
jgi:hypothetical protein